MKEYMEAYYKWENEKNLDPSLLSELKAITNENEIEDRFYKRLEFGTAGIRGVLGVGTNRMNVHTVAEVTQALANKLIAEGKQDDGVVIAYDVRHMSKEFAEMSATILSKQGVKTYLFEQVSATPILSYAVIELETAAGIMITASHNPKEYNGYKLYAADGTQIDKEFANSIVDNIEKIENLFEISTEIDLSKVEFLSNEFIYNYFSSAHDLQLHLDVDRDISIVYTPLHGVGREFVPRILWENGYENLHLVEEQMIPDPDFTTAKSPNPENLETFELAIREGLKYNADVLIATDPDADRVGVMVKHKGKYEMVSGNVLGTVLVDYILRYHFNAQSLPKNPKIVKTIVTDNLVDKIAEDYGVGVVDVHVGFKNIYSLVNEWQSKGDNGYIVGYEESLGFGISGDLAKDKDAITASLLICEMVGHYYTMGLSILDIYQSLQEYYGFHGEKLESISFPGKDGKEKMDMLVEKMRVTPIPEINGSKLIKAIDYLNDDTDLEKLNVLKCLYEDGSWFAVRPSGTEPKLKVYAYSVGENKQTSEIKAENILNSIKQYIQ